MRSAPALALFLPVLWSTSAFAQGVVPPEVLTRVDAVPPANAPAPLHEHVMLEFTILEDGTVRDVTVIESAGEAWDNAAATALKQWRFKPAQQNGQVVASRTRLTFNVAAPPPEEDAGIAGPPEPDAGMLEDGGTAWPLTEDADGGSPREYSTRVVGRAVPRSVSPSDFHLEVGELRVVPRRTASDYLKLAPGILITNEGGEGHPDQIFLRGFDAREGQDIELTAEGVPINESGNLHGNGYADLHFIIPELIENLRVVEGPFDPRQGNYAVAGSADYELGLVQRGLTAKVSVGLYDTQRVVLLWGAPGESTRSFAGVHLFRTSGWGQNRDAQYAGLMAQHEFSLSNTTTLRIGADGYIARYHSAGVLRADDVEAGRVPFDGTYDNRQGGDTARGSVHLDLGYRSGAFSNSNQLSFVLRHARLTDNLTGFLQDTQQARQRPHPQRGDALDRASTAYTFALKGFGRYRFSLFNRSHEVELGYFGRLDITTGLQEHLEAGTNTPYMREYDLASTLGDFALYGNANLNITEWLTLRGGVRAHVFTFDVHNKCAVQDVRRPASSDPPGDESCLDMKDFGKYREPDERVSAVGSAVMPRGTLLLGPFAGLTLSGAIGQGVRSVDPQYVNQNSQTPFASIFAWEGGLTFARKFEPVEVTARGVVFGTRVDKDLVFSEQAGRNIIGGATSRFGGLVSGRIRGSFFDLAVNGTFVRSTFDDTGLQVPYVPDVVLRGDGSVFYALPFDVFGGPIRFALGLGYTFVGQRALPFGQRSDVISVLDGSFEVSWRWITLGIACTNLLDTRYRLGEYNYASDFRTTGPDPTLVPARHFTAGAPRMLLGTLAVNLGGER